jgi:hypothetical protein
MIGKAQLLVIVHRIIIPVGIIIMDITRTTVLYLWKSVICHVSRVKVKVSVSTSKVHRVCSNSNSAISTQISGTPIIAITRANRLGGHRPIHADIAAAIIGIMIVATSSLLA